METTSLWSPVLLTLQLATYTSLILLLIATPLAWYTMSQWLQGFANRIEIPWWSFLIAGFLAVTVAFLTIGFQSVRAALLDPVDTLKEE